MSPMYRLPAATVRVQGEDGAPLEGAQVAAGFAHHDDRIADLHLGMPDGSIGHRHLFDYGGLKHGFKEVDQLGHPGHREIRSHRVITIRNWFDVVCHRSSF